MSSCLIIRHAESEANGGYPTSNPKSIGLTEKGKEQARALADKIIIKPDLVITTPYLRTQQTANPLLEKYPVVKCVEWPLHEFTYLSPVVCKNTTSEARQPMVQEYWKQCKPDLIHGEGAESFNQFTSRVIDNINRLKELNDQFVLVFTHGQVIRYMIQYVNEGFQNPDQAMRYFKNKMLPLSIANVDIFEFHTTENKIYPYRTLIHP